MALKRWAKYLYCDTCGAVEGKPCIDQRYNARYTSHMLTVYRAHKGRPKKEA